MRLVKLWIKLLNSPIEFWYNTIIVKANVGYVLVCSQLINVEVCLAMGGLVILHILYSR